MFKSSILDNGLKIISRELGGAETVTVKVSVDAGSKFVPLGKEGLAHMVEHVVMNGSREYSSPLAVRGAVEELGGKINASTGVDATTYTVKTARADLMKGMEILFSLLRHPLLDTKGFENEKLIISEEIARSQDILRNRLADELARVMYPSHPLGSPVLGTREAVAGLTIGDVKRFFETFYTPSRMVVAVVGDVAHQEVLNLVKHHFGRQHVADTPSCSYRRFSPREGEGFCISTVAGEVQQFRLLLGFPLKFADLKDILVAWVLANTLASKSRLFARLREKEGLAYDIGAQFNLLPDIASIVIRGGFTLGKEQRALSCLVDELAKLKRHHMGKREFRKVLKLSQMQLLFELEEDEAWANFALLWNRILGNTIEPKEFMEGVAAVSSSDVQKLARRLFVPEKAYLVVACSDGQTSRIEEISRKELVVL